MKTTAITLCFLALMLVGIGTASASTEQDTACVELTFSSERVLAQATGKGEIGLYMDDGGSGYANVRVGERCYVEGAYDTGYNPTTGQTGSVRCECSRGIGDVCLWVWVG